jgi:hypothetical protein
MSMTPQELQKLLEELEASRFVAAARLGKTARDPMGPERYCRNGSTAAGTEND